MPWLWFIGPLIVLFVGVIGGLFPSSEERRIRAELARWLDEVLGPLRVGKNLKSRRVRRVPPQFNRLLQEAGGGARVTDVVLLPKDAYVAVRVADALTSSNHATVLLRLGKAAPAMTCRPLPLVDGRLSENKGVIFSQDQDFNETFLVEGDDPKAIRKWLDEATREALLELPDLWLRTDGKSLALTLYGAPSADTLDELVGVADAVFAEKGVSPESLFGRAADKPAPKVRVQATPEPATPARRIAAGAIDFGLYALGVLAMAAMVGAFDKFHPAVFFSSPDLEITEAWQGGWTTKGFGAFVAAETLFCLVFVYQGFLAATRGSSIGKAILGARVVRTDGGPMNFLRGLLLRKYVFGVIPFFVAAYVASRGGPLTPRRFFEAVPTKATIISAAIVLGVLVVLTLINREGRGLHDKLSGTRVVATEGMRMSTVQLGLEERDPIVTRRFTWGVGAMLLFILVNVVAYNTKSIGYWIY